MRDIRESEEERRLSSFPNSDFFFSVAFEAFPQIYTFGEKIK